MAIQIQFRNDTAANWTSANPTLLSGEIGYETDTGKLKIGNGTSTWTALVYGPTIAGSITGATINNSTIGATTPSTGAFSTVTLSAGTASVAPLKLTSGANNTTAQAGAIEYDGSAFYSSVAASTRGTVPSEQAVVLNTAYTLTSQTTAQKLFNATSNGAVTLPVGTYQFECFYSLSSMSTTSSSFGFALAGTATYTQQWGSVAYRAATLANAAATTSTYSTTANTAITAAGTGANGWAWIRGIINVTVSGTVIPQVSLGVAAAAVVGVGSYFKISPISGTNSTTNIAIGNWS